MVVERIFGLNATTITTRRFPIKPTMKMIPNNTNTTRDIIRSTFSSNGASISVELFSSPPAQKPISLALVRFIHEGYIFEPLQIFFHFQKYFSLLCVGKCLCDEKNSLFFHMRVCHVNRISFLETGGRKWIVSRRRKKICVFILKRKKKRDDIVILYDIRLY